MVLGFTKSSWHIVPSTQWWWNVWFSWTLEISIINYIYHKSIFMAPIALKKTINTAAIKIDLHSFKHIVWMKQRLHFQKKIKHTSMRQFKFRLARLLLLLSEHCRGAKQWGAHFDEFSEKIQREGQILLTQSGTFRIRFYRNRLHSPCPRCACNAC